MDELKKEYEQISKEYDELADVVSELRNDEKVKKYIEYRNKLMGVRQTLYELQDEIKIKEYEDCNHIYAVSSYDNTDNYRSSKSCPHLTCIKCGLTTDALNPKVYRLHELNPHNEYSLMYKFMHNKSNYSVSTMPGISLSEDKVDTYDISLTKEKYEKIKEKNPHISDEEASTMLKEWHKKYLE